jgi:CubicO group peptidase (beta-lactamase class C family)
MRLKKFIVSGIIVIVLINILVVITDHTYLYKGIANTYLKGRKGPGIFDLDVFAKSTIPAKNSKKLASKQIDFKLNNDYQKRLEDIKTNSFIILENDSLAYESYWDTDKTQVSNSFSMAKSVIGILVGIAIKNDFIDGISDPVGKYIPHFNTDSLKHITLYHLLSMSSGLYWIESGANPFSHNAKAYYGNDLTTMVNELTCEKEPGITFEYKSGNSQVLAMVIQQATKMSVSDFAAKYLWNNIGAEQSAYWSLDHEGGVEKAYCCLYATGYDFAKLGLLMAHYGNYNGNQILDSSFVMASTMPTELLKTNGEYNNTYGLHWWVFDNYQDLSGYYARGILGQYIIVIPNHDLVIVRTGHERMQKSDENHPDDLFLYLDIAKDFIANEKRH